MTSLHNIRSDNFTVHKLKDTKSLTNPNNNNKIAQATCPSSNTFVSNVNNFISLTEHSTLPGSTSEAIKSRRDADDRNLILDKQINNIQSKREASKDQEMTKNLMLLEILSRCKNEDEKNSESLKRIKKLFEKNLAKWLARTFVNNLLKGLNQEDIFRKIMANYTKKNRESPSRDGSNISDFESGRDTKSQLKSNFCPHQNKPHYAKNLCKNCYLKQGRGKKAQCSHTDRPLYALSLCKQCYQTNYSKKRRRKRYTSNATNSNKDNSKNLNLSLNYVELLEQNSIKPLQNHNLPSEIPRHVIESYIKNSSNISLLSKKRKKEKGNFSNNFTPLGSSGDNNSHNNYNNSNSRNSKNTQSDEKFPSEDLIPQRVSGDFDYLNSSNLYMVNNEKKNNNVEYNDEYEKEERRECPSESSNYSDFVNFI